MKELAIVSLIALAGLYVTDTHAEATFLRCKVKACTNADTPAERCEADMETRATIADFGESFSVHYSQPGSTLSPPLTRNARGWDAGIIQAQTGEHLFMRRADGRAYAVILTGTRVAFFFVNCEVIN